MIDSYAYIAETTISIHTNSDQPTQLTNRFKSAKTFRLELSVSSLFLLFFFFIVNKVDRDNRKIDFYPNQNLKIYTKSLEMKNKQYD